MEPDKNGIVAVKNASGRTVAYGLDFVRIDSTLFSIQTFTSERCARVPFVNATSLHPEVPPEELLSKLLTEQEYSLRSCIIERLPGISGPVGLAYVMLCSTICKEDYIGPLLFGISTNQEALRFVWRYSGKNDRIRNGLLQLLTEDSIIDLLTAQPPFSYEDSLLQHLTRITFFEDMIEKRLKWYEYHWRNETDLLIRVWSSRDRASAFQWWERNIRDQSRSIGVRLHILQSLGNDFRNKTILTSLESFARDETLPHELRKEASELVQKKLITSLDS